MVVAALQVSWCKVELELPNAKGVRPAEAGSQLAAKPSPPLTVAALNLRLHMDPKTQQQEILAASVVHMSGVFGGQRGGSWPGCASCREARRPCAWLGCADRGLSMTRMQQFRSSRC